jgi:hypothetical protein
MSRRAIWILDTAPIIFPSDFFLFSLFGGIVFNCKRERILNIKARNLQKEKKERKERISIFSGGKKTCVLCLRCSCSHLDIIHSIKLFFSSTETKKKKKRNLLFCNVGGKKGIA